MSNEASREVFRALRDAQTRYDYFLLAAAGAAIGFALNQTQTAHLEREHVPLAGAVLCWGLSFYCGCRHLVYVNSALYANAGLLRLEAGLDPLAGTHPGMIEVGRETFDKIIERKNAASSRYANWQFRLLMLGAILYIGWHIGQMYSRTPCV